MNMKKPSLHLLIAAIVLMAVMGAYFFWYMAVQAKVTQTATLAQQIQTQTMATSRVQEAKNQLKVLDSDQATINQYYISTNDVVPFLEKLQATGKFLNANVEVVSVSANPGTPTGQLDLSVKITGSFDAVARTLGSIEYSPYDISLMSLTFDTLNSQNVGSSSPSWTAEATYTIGTVTTPKDDDSNSATSTDTTTPQPAAVVPEQPSSSTTIETSPITAS
jgi:Tfp pilus assembly protein PilO